MYLPVRPAQCPVVLPLDRHLHARERGAARCIGDQTGDYHIRGRSIVRSDIDNHEGKWYEQEQHRDLHDSLRTM
jgi:hypothetical protein